MEEEGKTTLKGTLLPAEMSHITDKSLISLNDRLSINNQTF